MGLEVWERNKGWRPRLVGGGVGGRFSAEGVSSLRGSEGSGEQDGKRPRRDFVWEWGRREGEEEGRRGSRRVMSQGKESSQTQAPTRECGREAAETGTEKIQQSTEI